MLFWGCCFESVEFGGDVMVGNFELLVWVDVLSRGDILVVMFWS